jgi:hypothetical protein
MSLPQLYIYYPMIKGKTRYYLVYIIIAHYIVIGNTGIVGIIVQYDIYQFLHHL